MNDPGLDGAIADAEKHHGVEDDIEQEEQEEEDLLLEPSRWWFASTASPLMAGTLGPMASSFNIIAIAQFWREHLLPGSGEDNSPAIQDPHWLLAVNGVSLVFAVIANTALCLNMVGRLRFAWAQPITIVGFFLAAILLLILVCIASKESFRPSPASDYALTQAWYYAAWATGLYFIIAILMTITVYGAIMGKFPKQFELNGSQRTLMLQTTAFMVYLVGGAAVYTQLEGWSYPDAIFWADFTLLTIGFGTPLVPVTHAGRSLLIPYLFGGLIAIGLVIGSIRAMLLEAGAIKMHARATEKKRQQVLNMKDAEDTRFSKWNILRGKRKPSKRADTQYKSERERRRQEFLAMRKIQERAENERKWTALGVSGTIGMGMWLIGAVIFWKAEYVQNWTYFEAMYFAFVALTTLGYGDVQPYSNAGKSFFVLWSLLAIPALTVLISDLGGTIVLLAADLTALIGSLTVAPTDKEFWRRVKRNWDILFGQNKHPNKPKVNTEQLAVLHKKDKLDDSRLGRWPDLLYARLTQSERDVIDNYGRNCEDSPHERDAFFYHFLIVKEIRTVLRDSQTDRKKTYTYDEWAYFLKLLGIDEENGDMHTKTYNQPKRDSEPGVQVGRVFDHQGKPVEWSWLSLRSPLLSLKSEPEWILDRLLKKMSSEVHLESRAKRERAAASGADTGAGPRFDMLRFMRRTSDDRGSGSGSADNDGLSSTATQRAEHEVEDKSGIGRDKTADPEAEEEDERLGLENETTDYDRDERQRQKKGEWNEADQEAHEKPSK